MISTKYLLLFICGLSWSIAYMDIIRIGFKQRTYAMPFLALAFNFTWEVYNSIQTYIIEGFHTMTIINIIWTALDFVIFYTYIKFGNFEAKKAKGKFYLIIISVLLLFFIIQKYMAHSYGFLIGGIYTAFVSNLVMSMLFIRMFFLRKGIKGQSLLIAYTKCIGTLSGTILVGIIGLNSAGGRVVSAAIIGLGILVFDLWYIYLLINKKKNTSKIGE